MRESEIQHKIRCGDRLQWTSEFSAPYKFPAVLTIKKMKRELREWVTLVHGMKIENLNLKLFNKSVSGIKGLEGMQCEHF